MRIWAQTKENIIKKMGDFYKKNLDFYKKKSTLKKKLIGFEIEIFEIEILTKN